MQLDDLILVSVDDHVVEPPDMFDRHLPAKYADRAPKVTKINGVDHWVFENIKVGSFGLNAVVSWPKEERGFDPASFAEMRPGAYDVNERVRDMNRNGVLASLCFPTFPGFCAGFLNQVDDKAITNVIVKAYNDWHIDEWCASHPGRFIPNALMPIWDREGMATEVRRVAAKGCHAVTMPELPHVMGLPSYNDLDYWDPFFTAVSDENVIVNMHIGIGFGAINNAPDASAHTSMIISNQVAAITAQDLLWGGAYQSYPDLKVAFSEGGIGWIAFYLDRCDRHYKNQPWMTNDFGSQLPSEIFRDHSLACFVTDPTALKVRHDIGMDIIAWECDYPHSDANWPDAPELIHEEMVNAGCTDGEMHKITWENASRFYGYDPFKFIPREQANVGVLRSLSPDVDTAIRSRKEWQARFEAKASSAA